MSFSSNISFLLTASAFLSFVQGGLVEFWNNSAVWLYKRFWYENAYSVWMMNAKMTHFVWWWTDKRSRWKIRGSTSVVTVGIKTKVEANIQKDRHYCINFNFNSLIQLYYWVLSTRELPIVMHFHLKPSFEFVSLKSGLKEGFFVVSVCSLSVKHDALFLIWPLHHIIVNLCHLPVNGDGLGVFAFIQVI